jgi:hypothetical protein
MARVTSPIVNVSPLRKQLNYFYETFMPFYIPINNELKFQLLHVLGITCFCQSYCSYCQVY